MIWSVSTLVRRSGMALPVCVTNGSMMILVSLEVCGGGQAAGDRGRGGDDRRYQVGAAALALTALEVPVGGGGGALPRLQGVGVHAQAHRAARAAPLGTGRREDLVKPLGLGLRADLHRAGDDQHADAVGYLAALDDVGGRAQVLDPAVGAGTHEDRVDRDLAQRRAGRQAHVGEGPLGAVRVLGLTRRGHGRAERERLAGVGAPGDVRAQRGRVDGDLAVEDRALVGRQAPPVLDRRVPVGAPRSVRAALEVGDRGLVRGDEAGPRSRLDGHVADRQPAFHRQRADRLAAVFDDVALAAAGADLRDDRENQVLGGDAVGQRALDVDRHRLRLDLRQRLGGQDVLDLAGADAKGDRAERAVSGGVGVTADDRQARLGQPELRADDVHDALAGVPHRVQPDAELVGVPAQRLELDAGDRVGYRTARTLDRRSRADAGSRGDVVVLGRDREVGPPDLAAGGTQAVEGLGAGDLVHEVQVDEEQVWFTLLAAHHMGIPDLLRERARRGAHAVHLLWLGSLEVASQDLRRQYQHMNNTSGVGVLDKAVWVLAAVESGPATLAQLVSATGLARPTTHRIAVALEHHRLLARDVQGRFVLGPRVAELAAAAGEDRLLAVSQPVLIQLRDVTGESAQLYRYAGGRGGADVRVCVAAAERASGLRDTVPIGAALPMTAGSAAQILLAWEEGERMHRGLRGAKFTATTLAGVRRRGWAASAAEREAGVAPVPARGRGPGGVGGRGGRVLAAVSVSGPIERLTRSPGRLHAAAVVAAGEKISDLLRAEAAGGRAGSGG